MNAVKEWPYKLTGAVIVIFLILSIFLGALQDGFLTAIFPGTVPALFGEGIFYIILVYPVLIGTLIILGARARKLYYMIKYAPQPDSMRHFCYKLAGAVAALLMVYILGKLVFLFLLILSRLASEEGLRTIYGINWLLWIPLTYELLWAPLLYDLAIITAAFLGPMLGNRLYVNAYKDPGVR